MPFFKKQPDPRARIFQVIVILVILFIVGAIAAQRASERNQGPDKRIDLAQCLTEKGAKFYGAYWCPHCSRQKKLFGSKAMTKLTYVECAVPGNTQEQTQECKDANISGYPTWTFADGSRLSGEQTFKDLAAKTGCEWTEQP